MSGLLDDPDLARASAHRLQVSLANPNRYPEASARRIRPWLEEMVTALRTKVNGDAAAQRPATLAVRFTSDREVRRLNREYREHDRSTDVLSFPGSETPEGQHLGDIAISVPIARRQASTSGHSVDRELKVLLLHGVLHCLGYDHETDGGTMSRLERRLRRKWIDAESGTR